MGANTVTIDGTEYDVTLANFNDVASVRIASRERQLGRRLDVQEREAVLDALRNLAYAYANSGAPTDPNQDMGQKIIDDRRKAAPFLTGISDALADVGRVASGAHLDDPYASFKKLVNDVAIGAIVYLILQLFISSKGAR